MFCISQFSNLYPRIKFLSRKLCKFQKWLLPTSLKLVRSQDMQHWGRGEIPHILFQLWPATFCLPQIPKTPPPCIITKTHKVIKAQIMGWFPFKSCYAWSLSLLCNPYHGSQHHKYAWLVDSGTVLPLGASRGYIKNATGIASQQWKHYPPPHCSPTERQQWEDLIPGGTSHWKREESLTPIASIFLPSLWTNSLGNMKGVETHVFYTKKRNYHTILFDMFSSIAKVQVLFV